MGSPGWASWLRDALDERGWDQAELSRRGALDDALVSRWLSGKVRPGLASIRAVCATLDVPPSQGMIAAGHLEPDDVGATVINRPRTVQLQEISNRELLDEIARRMDK